MDEQPDPRAAELGETFDGIAGAFLGISHRLGRAAAHLTAAFPGRRDVRLVCDELTAAGNAALDGYAFAAAHGFRPLDGADPDPVAAATADAYVAEFTPAALDDPAHIVGRITVNGGPGVVITADDTRDPDRVRQLISDAAAAAGADLGAPTSRALRFERAHQRLNVYAPGVFPHPDRIGRTGD